MTLDELLRLPIAGKNLLVIGSPASGKTHIANLLCYDQSHQVLHTDDTVNAGYTLIQATWSLFEDIGDCNNRSTPTIVEGVLGYTLLLEGFIHKSYFPQIVIDVKISRGRQREIYLKERDSHKLKYLKKFEFAHLEMMNEYHRIVPVEQKPTFITLENNWSYVTEKQD